MSFRKSRVCILTLLITLCIVLTGCKSYESFDQTTDIGSDSSTVKITEGGKITQKQTEPEEEVGYVFDIADIKPYSGKPYIVVNNNQPEFKSTELKKKAYEFYSELDSLGRCGYAMACVCTDTMPELGAERTSITNIKPTGWINNSYDSSIVPGKYIYNRCHLIGWQLTDENSNRKNLITGTRYLNTEGMLPFENMIADYVRETDNHVMYRVTPIFEGNNLVASGVHMEGYSVEDKGAGICFNVYAYNVQPGIEIDYATGENKLDDSHIPPQTEPPETDQDQPQTPEQDQNQDQVQDPEQDTDQEQGDSEFVYILNTNRKKIHYPHCSSIATMSEKNKQGYNGTVEELLSQGYTTCGICKPE